jgi:dTDP-4-dehydrorhamnose reductase
VVATNTKHRACLATVLACSLQACTRAGCTEEYADFFLGPVHVEDVAMAHILVFESASASGRHLCVHSICHWSDFAAKVAELYPDYKVPKYAERNHTQFPVFTKKKTD